MPNHQKVERFKVHYKIYPKNGLSRFYSKYFKTLKTAIRDIENEQLNCICHYETYSFCLSLIIGIGLDKEEICEHLETWKN